MPNPYLAAFRADVVWVSHKRETTEAQNALGRSGRELMLPGRGRVRTCSLRRLEGAVCTEILDLYQTEGIISEPAGALAVPPFVANGDRPPRSLRVETGHRAANR
jgi:hypothetical protein